MLPFQGALKGVSWNLRGWFAADPHRMAMKTRRVRRLLQQHDVVCIQETHANAGEQLAFGCTEGVKAYFSAGTNARGGIAILLSTKFLASFDPAVSHWEELVPGRLGILRLRGPFGGLNIVNCYFPTGTRERIGATREEAHDQDSILRQRREMMNSINRVLQSDEAATWVCGDFNWVPGLEDRINKANGEWTGAKDRADASHWDTLFKNKLFEIFQPEMTHNGAFSRGRLDRVYADFSVSDQFLGKFYAHCGLEESRVSDHRPLHFGRILSQNTDEPSCRPLPRSVFRHPDFAVRTTVLYKRRLADVDSTNAFVQLRVLKESMRATAAQLLREARGPDEKQVDLQDRLGLLIGLLRRVTRGVPLQWNRLARQLPDLAPRLTQEQWDRDRRGVIAIIREALVQQARAEVRTDLGELQRTMQDECAEEVVKRRAGILRKIARLCPGRQACVVAVLLRSGEVVADQHAAVAAVSEHWAGTFQARPHDPSSFRRFASMASPAIAEMKGVLGSKTDAEWRIRRGDVSRAIREARHSASGPDGLPAAAWLAMGELGEQVLFQVATALEDPDGDEQMEQAFPPDANGVNDYNRAIMVCIPKKPSGVTAEGLSYFAPKDLRPLSIVNVDNRLVSNAARIRMESHLSEAISEEQRGFIAGRSMLRNVVEVDAEMRIACAEGCAPGAVLFDFQAAFPSLDHCFMRSLLCSLGVPATARRFIERLYRGHGCCLLMNGALGVGFRVSAGIRQGCPLSPIVFALCLDPFLRTLRKARPGTLLRAYADDVAAVDGHVLDMLDAFLPLFHIFALASGLELNLRKTVYIPLRWDSVFHLRRNLLDRCPGLGAMQVQFWGEYLGFMLGPEAGSRSWDKVGTKAKQRAWAWTACGLGLHWSVIVFNVFILSMAGFLLQLLPPDAVWVRAEGQVIQALFPGPFQWIMAKDLQEMRRELGMHGEVKSVTEVSLATRLRVLHREARAGGGLHARSLVRRIDSAARASEAMATAAWRTWMAQSFAHHLVSAEQELQAKGITAAGLTPHQAVLPQLHPGLQRDAHRALRDLAAPHWERRLRQSLARFPVSVLPGRRPARAIATMRALVKVVQPRVASSILRTWMSGWCTQRRFGGAGQCMWGCQSGCDGLGHYVTCLRFARAVAKVTHRSAPSADPAERATSFLLLDMPQRLERREFKARALGTAACYKLHCVWRRRQRQWAALEDAGREAALLTVIRGLQCRSDEDDIEDCDEVS